MTAPVRYVLDANVLIEAARRYYAFDLAPAFWDALVEQARNGKLCSIDYVLEELKLNKDELSRWAKTKFKSAFRSTGHSDIIARYNQIINWVTSQAQYTPAAKSDFARGADGWIVAYARVKSFTVVTQERVTVRR
jgi:hypothetical protein